ncbi:hypothetical protein T10_2309, partial [Trichinella papuae]
MRFVDGLRLARFSSARSAVLFIRTDAQIQRGFHNARRWFSFARVTLSTCRTGRPHLVSLLYKLLFRSKDEEKEICFFFVVLAPFLILKNEDKFHTSISFSRMQ